MPPPHVIWLAVCAFGPRAASELAARGVRACGGGLKAEAVAYGVTGAATIGFLYYRVVRPLSEYPPRSPF